MPTSDRSDRIEAILAKCIRDWNKKQTYEPVQKAKDAIKVLLLTEYKKSDGDFECVIFTIFGDE